MFLPQLLLTALMLISDYFTFLLSIAPYIRPFPLRGSAPAKIFSCQDSNLISVGWPIDRSLARSFAAGILACRCSLFPPLLLLRTLMLFAIQTIEAIGRLFLVRSYAETVQMYVERENYAEMGRPAVRMEFH